MLKHKRKKIMTLGMQDNRGHPKGRQNFLQMICKNKIEITVND